MTHSIVINGKFLRAPPTGVHRVAAELANALADLKTEGHPSVSEFDMSLCVPADAEKRAREIRIPTRTISFLTGIPWEQLTLPFYRRKAMLISLCNIGPVVARNAVTMIHDVQVHISPESYSKGFQLWYRLIQPVFARRHRMILTVSAFSKAEIARVGLCAPEKIKVIHNGVDHILRDEADPAVLDCLQLMPRQFIVALSTTQAHKNISILLKAFARPEMAQFKLVLIGSTKPSDFLAAGMSPPVNTVFTGRISDGAMRALMENALCIAFPSTTEGFGLPPLEAMLLGCPAVVAPCGALPEVCGEATLYAEPFDDSAWSEQIRSIADSPQLRARLSVAGMQHAAQFTWRSAAIQLAKAISSASRVEQG
jgi:glycosyltransferase involved in cell wall biosynthesis